MDYDSFRAAWANALHKSGLRRIDLQPEETIETRTLDRAYETHIEPLGGQDAPPFHVTATLRWGWHALNATRGWVGDEAVLQEMVGREAASELLTEKRYVRVDFKLSARAPYGHPLPLPSSGAWQRWVRETVQRLEDIEPLLPEETWRETTTGVAEVLAWQGAPKATVVCTAGGELRLEGVETSAGQLVELPRVLLDADEPGDRTAAQLAELFVRLRAALAAWMQALDHLRPAAGHWEAAYDDGA